jgi:hypothetical protein
MLLLLPINAGGIVVALFTFEIAGLLETVASEANSEPLIPSSDFHNNWGWWFF